MSTNEHLEAIGTISDGILEFAFAPTKGDYDMLQARLAMIEGHAEALAAELEAAVANRDFENAELNRMTRSWEQAQAALEAERAAEPEDFSGKLDALRDANTRWQIQCAELKNTLSTEWARVARLQELVAARAELDEEERWHYYGSAPDSKRDAEERYANAWDECEKHGDLPDEEAKQ